MASFVAFCATKSSSKLGLVSTSFSGSHLHWYSGENNRDRWFSSQDQPELPADDPG
jgi:hypothetical protein